MAQIPLVLMIVHEEEENNVGERGLAVFCSSILLILAAFALIGMVSLCKWLAGVM